MIGSALTAWLMKEGHAVSRIVRPQTQGISPDDGIAWDIEQETIALRDLEGYDCVVHLAGANIAGQRWTSSYKNLIRESRVQGTRFLAESLAKLKNPPRIFLSTSAVGYYGNRPSSEKIDEDAENGEGFLAGVCREWESATQAAELAGIRVVHMRMGVVLSASGGALTKMLPAFKMGLGGPIGSGEQMFSWIALDEIPPIVLHLFHSENIKGPVNLVTPNPVSNMEFAKVLGGIISRPAFMPLPKLGVSILFGEMGNELLLSGARVIPRKLNESGYSFRHPELKLVLETLLK